MCAHCFYFEIDILFCDRLVKRNFVDCICKYAVFLYIFNRMTSISMVKYLFGRKKTK